MFAGFWTTTEDTDEVDRANRSYWQFAYDSSDETVKAEHENSNIRIAIMAENIFWDFTFEETYWPVANIDVWSYQDHNTDVDASWDITDLGVSL